MIIIGLDGKEHKWNIKGQAEYIEEKSKIHLLARNLLRETYPYDIIREEVNLPGTKTIHHKLNLIADFYLPGRALIIEVNGPQHFKYSSFFHKNKMAFLKAKARDIEKKRWCEINSIRLIDFNYDEKVEEWKLKL
jgi:hypothetical protein